MKDRYCKDDDCSGSFVSTRFDECRKCGQETYTSTQLDARELISGVESKLGKNTLRSLTGFIAGIGLTLSAISGYNHITSNKSDDLDAIAKFVLPENRNHAENYNINGKETKVSILSRSGNFGFPYRLSINYGDMHFISEGWSNDVLSQGHKSHSDGDAKNLYSVINNGLIATNEGSKEFQPLYEDLLRSIAKEKEKLISEGKSFIESERKSIINSMKGENQ